MKDYTAKQCHPHGRIYRKNLRALPYTRFRRLPPSAPLRSYCFEGQGGGGATMREMRFGKAKDGFRGQGRSPTVCPGSHPMLLPVVLPASTAVPRINDRRIGSPPGQNHFIP